MARITRIEIMMVDLKPKVRRTDAIQSFESQETPILRITDADGAVGTGYSYTIGTGGPSVIALPRHGGGCDYFAGAGCCRHGAVGSALPPGRAAAMAVGGRGEGLGPAIHHRRRLAAYRDGSFGR